MRTPQIVEPFREDQLADEIAHYFSTLSEPEKKSGAITVTSAFYRHELRRYLSDPAQQVHYVCEIGTQQPTISNSYLNVRLDHGLHLQQVVSQGGVVPLEIASLNTEHTPAIVLTELVRDTIHALVLLHHNPQSDFAQARLKKLTRALEHVCTTEDGLRKLCRHVLVDLYISPTDNIEDRIAPLIATWLEKRLEKREYFVYENNDLTIITITPDAQRVTCTRKSITKTAEETIVLGTSKPTSIKPTELTTWLRYLHTIFRHEGLMDPISYVQYWAK